MTLRVSLPVIPLIMLMSVPASAFDCTKAKTAVEKAICADPALKRMDDELAAAYGSVKTALAAPEQKMLALSQKRWIARREACSAEQAELNACVKRQTVERVALLSGRAASGPGPQGRLVPVFITEEGTATSPDVDMALLRFAEPQSPGEIKLNELADEIAAAAQPGNEQGSKFRARVDTFNIAYASPAFMSVRHFFYVDEGGAHGNSGTENYNISMESGELAGLDDVLPAPSAAILSLWCKQQIETEKQKRVPGIDLSEEAAGRDKTIAAQVRDLSNWSIGEAEIVVSFDPYAVGAYAEGAYECRFPTAGVKQMAIAGAPLP